VAATREFFIMTAIFELVVFPFFSLSLLPLHVPRRALAISRSRIGSTSTSMASNTVLASVRRYIPLLPAWADHSLGNVHASCNISASLVVSSRVLFSAREGHISNEPDGPEIEYRSSPAIISGIYYYIAGGGSYSCILGLLSPPMLDPLWLDEEVMNDRASSSAHCPPAEYHRRTELADEWTPKQLSGLPHHSPLPRRPGVSEYPLGRSKLIRVQVYFEYRRLIGENLSSHPWRASMTYGTDCCFRFLCTVLLGSLGSHFCESVICCIPILDGLKS
jgi:hypothetical protein